SCTDTLPALPRSPLRRYQIVVVAGSAGPASVANATSQFTRSLPLPVTVIGPSLTMLPPRKVMMLFDTSPPGQSTYQSPRGTVRLPLGLHEYTEVQRVNPAGTPVPPSAATRSAMAESFAVGQPFDARQLYRQSTALRPTGADDAIGAGSNALPGPTSDGS